LTAPARHAWRVEKTIAAAAAVLGNPCRVMQAALIALDLHGTGGTAGCGAGAGETVSLRAPWARGLGKGRWQASDGRAYRAAAEQALGALIDAELGARRSALPPEAQPEAQLFPPLGGKILSSREWVEARGCGLLDSPWQLGCRGLPVLAPSVVLAVLHDADATVAQQARGYALHRLAERALRDEPLGPWAEVVRVARERIGGLEATAAAAVGDEVACEV